MVEPLDIATAAHTICEETLIPNGVSPNHDVTMHAPTTALYALKINEAELDVTGEQVIQAILSITQWDKASAWPGHPHPDLVIAYLAE